MGRLLTTFGDDRCAIVKFKTRVPGLSYGIVCMILHSDITVPAYDKCTEKRSDGHTMTANDVLA